jgi:DNA-binding GntR family transcriptional regulator
MDVTEALRSEILTGSLPPGTLLMQTDLAERFGVSRIPVRDALQRLAAEKLVTVMPGKGAQVVSLDRAGLVEIYDMRVLLECSLIMRATRAAGPEDHEAAGHMLRKSDLEAGRPGWAAGDWAFHAALYAPAERPRQMELVSELRRTAQVHVAHYDRLASSTPRWLDDHARLLEAFVAGHADQAAAILGAHIIAARDHLLAAMPA